MRNVLRHRWLRPKPTAVATAVVLLACAAAAGLPACAHRSTGAVDRPGDVPYPPWVLAGSGAGADGGQRNLVGMGQIDGMRNVALARATADNRARAEVARVLTAFLGTLLARATAATTAANAPDGRMARTAQPASDASTKVMLAAVLPMVQVVDHWFHPDRGAVFALARIDLSDVHDALARARDLPENLVSALLANLDAVHAGMTEAASRRADPAAKPLAAEPNQTAPAAPAR